MAEPDPAIRRFWLMQATRLGGVLMAMVGALIIGDVVDWPEAVGYALLVLGAADFFILPALLAKRWKTDAR